MHKVKVVKRTPQVHKAFPQTPEMLAVRAQLRAKLQQALAKQLTAE